MKTQIQKWGNSLALRLPKSFANDSKIEQGSTVEISLVGGKIIVEPVRAPAFTLGDLLAGVRKSNLHSEIEAGEAVGKEAW
jgi:antitoxin MazE